MRILLLALVISIQATFPDTFSPNNSAYNDIEKKYHITFTYDLPNSYSPLDEDDLAWDYFDKDPFIVLGYDASASREFDVIIENQRSVVVTFTLTFGAATFKNNFATNGQELEAALTTDSLNNNLGFNAASLNPESTAADRSNCDAVTILGTKLCSNMACKQLDLSGAVECSSQCAAENIKSACGANGNCAQEAIDKDHVCSCPSDTWWTTGNDEPGSFGDGADPCKPVLENWLIIVIAIFGFLFIVLIIIMIIYCCVRGCVCPCACTCCDKPEEVDEKSQLKYEVRDSPRGMTNDAYQPDLVETGSQRPLYEKYLPEDKLTKNSAAWYDNSFTRELHKPNRKGADNQDSFRTDAVGETSTLPPSVSMHHERRQQRDYSTVDNHRDEKRSRNRRSDGKRRRRRSRERSPPRDPENPYTKEMKREIKKLQSEIDTLKRDIDQPPNDESILSGTSTIQAPLQPTGPIDALELSDENVDGAENIYNSKAVLVPAPTTKSNDDLKNTLKERWRVPTLTVKPLDDQNSVSQVESSVI